jgi:hypothetical protein
VRNSSPSGCTRHPRLLIRLQQTATVLLTRSTDSRPTRSPPTRRRIPDGRHRAALRSTRNHSEESSAPGRGLARRVTQQLPGSARAGTRLGVQHAVARRGGPGGPDAGCAVVALSASVSGASVRCPRLPVQAIGVRCPVRASERPVSGVGVRCPRLPASAVSDRKEVRSVAVSQAATRLGQRRSALPWSSWAVVGLWPVRPRADREKLDAREGRPSVGSKQRPRYVVMV